MNGKDLFLGMCYVKTQFIEEAETVTVLDGQCKPISFRKTVLIAAVIALLVLTVTACAYAIRRIRMDLVQYNIPIQTEKIIADADHPEETVAVNILTDYYPQALPAGYSILSGSPTTHTARGIVYQNENGRSIHFHISVVPQDNDFALRPPVEQTTVTLPCGEATHLKNEEAQALLWQDEEIGYDASLFTDDVTVDLVAIAKSMDYGNTIPLSVWYHRGAQWDPWYPQTLPEGYICKEVSPLGSGYQTFIYENGSNGYIRYGISTVRDLIPTRTGSGSYWEETQVSGFPAKMLHSPDGRRTLIWYHGKEDFHAFLETGDASVDLIALAEAVAPGVKMEVSLSRLGPDFSIALEQEAGEFISWQSIYPQSIPEGYTPDRIGTRAYGRQAIQWANAEGEIIIYTLYYRLGQQELRFDGNGQPEPVSVRGLMGYRVDNRLLWADGSLGYGYELYATGDVDLMAVAESVGFGPELIPTNDRTAAALAELGDYRITDLPGHMVEDELIGSPLEEGGGWYSYVRRWYYDTTNADHVYFTYESYRTNCSDIEERLRMLIGLNTDCQPEFTSVNGCPGIILQDGSTAKVAWVLGDAAKGTSFQLYSEHFTAQELLRMAGSIQKR